MNPENRAKEIISESEPIGVPESCLLCKFCRKQDAGYRCERKEDPITGLDVGCRHWRDKKGQSVFDIERRSANRKRYRRILKERRSE